MIEAIKTLKENICAQCAYGSDMEKCDILYCDNRAAIKALEQELCWIPVSERLPEDRRVVEVTAFWHEAYQTMQGAYFGSSYFYSDGEWWCVPFNNTGEHMQRLDVIAWKELSKPYKEVSE